MELRLTGKNMELTTEIRDFVQRKLGKLDRHLTHIKRFDVELFEEKTKFPEHHFVAQVTIDSNGTLLRGEERAEQLFAAIDKVTEVMDRQIEHYKGKRDQKSRETARIPAQPPEPPETGRVVKVKRFNIKPMSVEEAVDQMELLRHDFFLFRNAETEKVNLIYRRKDADYGLIEPE